jgi:hypothetical protein
MEKNDFKANRDKISNMLEEKMKNIKDKNNNNEDNDSKSEKKENEILIFKDKIYEDYKDKLINFFTLWSLGYNTDSDFDSFDIKKSVIKNVNILEILFNVSAQLNDPDFTLKFI